MSVEHRLGRLEQALPQPRPLPAHVAEEPISTMVPRFLRYLYLDPTYADEGPTWHEAIWRELELLHGSDAARLFGHDGRPSWDEIWRCRNGNAMPLARH